MEYPAPKYVIDGREYDILSMDEFKTRIGKPDLPTPTIAYQMSTNKLDWVKLGTFRYIIYNEKAQNMKVLPRRPNRK